MSTITKHNENSMAVLHLPWLDVYNWTNCMQQQNFTFIKAPIIIGSSKPTGYSASWANKPLSCTQAFFMYKNRAAKRPYHNAWTMFQANKKSQWRELWCDLAVLKSGDFLKTKDEIQTKVGQPPFFVFSQCHHIAHAPTYSFFFCSRSHQPIQNACAGDREHDGGRRVSGDRPGRQ